MTWGDYGSAVERVGRALLALGLRRGDRVSLLCSNRPEWFFVDIGCMSMGATTVPIYVTSSPQQVAHVVGHSRSRVVVVENEEQLRKLLPERGRLPDLNHVVVLDEWEPHGDIFPLSWEGFQALAEEVSAADFELERSRLRGEEVATFVYTSGTTATPRAVMLTHDNIWWTCEAVQEHIRMEDVENLRALSYLPLSHVAERVVSHLLQIYYGSRTWFAGSLDSLREDLLDCRPTYFFGVPRVWEKFHAAVRARLDERPSGVKERVEQALLRRAIAVGGRVTDAEQDAVGRGRPVSKARMSPALRLQHALFDRVVLSRARARAGLERCTRSFSAAAPLDPEIIRFFHALGLKIAEGYGQSETCGPTTWNPPDGIRIGSVGTPLPGLSLRIAQDGEVLVKGGNVSPGYHDDNAANTEAFDEEGWLRSGDIGRRDEHGYVYITDRKKDLIITAAGKNVAPQELENVLRQNEIVSQVVVIGEGRPYLTALVTLDEESAPAWGREQGISGSLNEIAAHERTLEEIGAAIEELNRSVSRPEQIKRFRVLDRDFTQERDEITPTLKVKRRRIADLYAHVIDEMYAGEAPRAAAGSASG